MTIGLPHHFTPRPYQLPVLQAMDRGCKRAVQVWHRRAGKEKTDLAGVVARKMLERVGAYYYVLPTLVQGRKIVWDGMDRDGFRTLGHFPTELLAGKPNDTEMKLRYRNGSLFQVVGSDRFDSVMGTNPVGMVFSEYSLQDPLCWAYFRPILAENGGWAMFNFTPRGENHAYQLWELAKANPFDPATGKGWFSQLLAAPDTGAIAAEVLEQERVEMLRLYGTDGIFLQEYHCSFTVPVAGAYYAEQLGRAYAEGRVGRTPHDEALRVDTYWDLGVNDRMAVWFVQCPGGGEVRFIDYMEGSGQGLPWYIARLKEKGYVYGRHVAPHDIKQRELTSGQTRLKTAAELGIEFSLAPGVPVADGIDAARSLLSRCRFDADRCRDGLNALKNYRKEWSDARKTWGGHPYHDWSSNGADAFRYAAVSMDPKTRTAPARRPDKYERAAERGRAAEGPSGVAALG